nr:hypothetical protein [Tanacetum cinerariifolium]
MLNVPVCQTTNVYHIGFGMLRGIAKALAARDADRNTNGDDNHVSRTESDKIERYIGGLLDMIHGSMVASKPKTMQEAIEMATELMDKNFRTFAKRQTENKRKQDDNNNQAQQQPLKKQCVATAYTVGPGERKEYAGTLPLCNKCKFHHNGQCTIKCVNCKRVGHLTRDCRNPATTNNHRNLTCFECGNQGHYKSDCSELKNQNHENQAGGTGAHGMAHALEGGKQIKTLMTWRMISMLRLYSFNKSSLCCMNDFHLAIKSRCYGNFVRITLIIYLFIYDTLTNVMKS